MIFVKLLFEIIFGYIGQVEVALWMETKKVFFQCRSDIVKVFIDAWRHRFYIDLIILQSVLRFKVIFYTQVYNQEESASAGPAHNFRFPFFVFVSMFMSF